MRVGLLGDANGYDEELRGLCAFFLFDLEVDALLAVSQTTDLRPVQRFLARQLERDGGEDGESDLWTDNGSLWSRALTQSEAAPEVIDRFVTRERRKLALRRIGPGTSPQAELSLPHAGGLRVVSRAELTGAQPAARILVYDGLSKPVVRQSGEGFVLNPGDLGHAGAMLVHDSPQHLTISLFDRDARLVEQHKLIAYGKAAALDTP